MKIIWSDFASETLKEIYNYYREVANEKIATKIKESVFTSTRQLVKHPNSGQLEETLKKLKEGHRYLVTGNFKIVYKYIREGILITDVFDTRQDPRKINNPKRNSSRL